MSDEERYRALGETVKKGGCLRWVAILIALLLLSYYFLGGTKIGEVVKSFLQGLGR